MRNALRVPSGSTRGTTKQVSPLGRLRQHEEHVAHRRRAEPLVPGRAGTRRRPVGVAPWCVLARTSEPPCFSVIPMPASSPAFCAGRPAARGRTSWTPAAASTRSARPVVGAQRGHRGVRHRDRAAVPGLDLRPDEEAGRAASGGRRASAAAHGAAVQPVARRPWSSARARTGGTRPRRPGCRSGRGCAAPAGCALAVAQCSRLRGAGQLPSGVRRRRARRCGRRRTRATASHEGLVARSKTSYADQRGGWTGSSLHGSSPCRYGRAMAAGTGDDATRDRRTAAAHGGCSCAALSGG